MDWIKQSSAEKCQIKYLLVGSDMDVDEDTAYKANGLMLTTDPKEIKRCVKSTGEKLVVICTYQSSDKLVEACQKIPFDFGIFDEAHKTVGQVNKKFTAMIMNDQMVIRRRLFMTATLKIYKGALEDDAIISMDDEKFYGQKLFTYNTGNAIKDKRLVDYQVVTICARNSDIENAIKKNQLVKFKKKFDIESNYLGTAILLLKKIHDGTCCHVITYHNRVSKSKEFAELLLELNDVFYDNAICVDHLDGSCSMGHRQKIIREFTSNNKSILCSARVLNEGVNIPIVDGVCFVDPRKSTIDIVQCIGRALRLCENKKKSSFFEKDCMCYEIMTISMRRNYVKMSSCQVFGFRY